MRSGFVFSSTLVFVAALVSGCGHKTDDTSAVLAKVNDDGVTQLQLDYARKQIVAARPGASAPTDAQILQSLVEQRLVVQKAEKDKLDRNPGVLQAIEAARNDALARFAVEQMTSQVPKPTADEIQRYFDGHPANFSERNIYLIQKVDGRVPADQAAALIASLRDTTSAAQVVDVMKSKTTGTNVTQAPEPAESLGALLPKFAGMKVGQSISIQQAQGLTALTLISIQPMPVSLQQAQASIEQLLWNQRKRDALQAETKALRTSAKIDYLGNFAAAAASAASR